MERTTCRLSAAALASQASPTERAPSSRRLADSAYPAGATWAARMGPGRDEVAWVRAGLAIVFAAAYVGVLVAACAGLAAQQDFPVRASAVASDDAARAPPSVVWPRSGANVALAALHDEECAGAAGAAGATGALAAVGAVGAAAGGVGDDATGAARARGVEGEGGAEQEVTKGGGGGGGSSGCEAVGVWQDLRALLIFVVGVGLGRVLERRASREPEARGQSHVCTISSCLLW